MKNKVISPSNGRSDQNRPVPALAFSHQDIAASARDVWNEKGQPEGRDEEIWFEAERRLKHDRAAQRDKRAFANPASLLNPDNEPDSRVENRLREAAAPAQSRSATSL
jgi:hypothetical protein